MGGPGEEWGNSMPIVWFSSFYNRELLKGAILGGQLCSHGEVRVVPGAKSMGPSGSGLMISPEARGRPRARSRWRPFARTHAAHAGVGDAFASVVKQNLPTLSYFFLVGVELLHD